MSTNTATSSVTKFHHDYEEWSDSDYFSWRSTYCCGLLEVHGIQSMPTYADEFGEPDIEDWEHHVWAHLAYRLLNKQMFGQVFFTYVTHSDNLQVECGECDADGGYYDDDDDWHDCEYCDGSGYSSHLHEIYPVWKDLEFTGTRLGIPAGAFKYGPEFVNPNTGNKCQMLILTVDQAVRDAFRTIYNGTVYTGDFRHR